VKAEKTIQTKKQKNGTISGTIFTPFKELIIFRKHQTPEFTHSVSQMCTHFQVF
jgi:hypothetical protein